MRTPDGWVIPMPKSLAEDLAWSLVSLAGQQGLASVTIRGLARHTRMAPGTITNHFLSKRELWAVCATVVGGWLADATSDHVVDRGAVGLFPDSGDTTYRLLVSAWSQLRAHALTDPDVDQRVAGMTTMVRRSAGRACVADARELSAAAWACLETLRQELVRPGSELTPADALAVLQQVEPSARRVAPDCADPVTGIA